MKEKREEKRARRRASDPEELTKAHVPADMKERTSAEQSVSLAGAWRTPFKLLSKTGRRRARAFFVFLAIAIGWSAYPQNGNIRAQEPKPSFEHQVAYITARISIRPLGSVKKEMHGTGFFGSSGFLVGGTGHERASKRPHLRTVDRWNADWGALALMVERWLVPLIPFPSYKLCASDRPGAVKGARFARRSEPLTARTDLESYEGEGKGILQPSSHLPTKNPEEPIFLSINLHPE